MQPNDPQTSSGSAPSGPDTVRNPQAAPAAIDRSPLDHLLARVGSGIADEAAVVGDYEITGVLGRGGTSVVFRARQSSLDREVALKVFGGDDREVDAEIMAEARLAARLAHPGIVQVIEVGRSGRLRYLSMQMIDGETLSRRLDRLGPMKPAEAAALARDICEAVHYAHEMGMLHLDLKPGNILIGADGRPHVADFGLARMMDASGGIEVSCASGTPSYMAPEQAIAWGGRLRRTADVYGLGAILYELLTGRPPHRGATVEATMALARDASPESVRQHAPHCPRDLEAIVSRCLTRLPTARYSSLREVSDELTRFLGRFPVKARPLSVAERLLRWMRREPRAGLAAAFAVVSLVVGTVASVVLWQRAEQRSARLAEAVGMLAETLGSDGDDGSREASIARAVRWLTTRSHGQEEGAEVLARLASALVERNDDGSAVGLLDEVTVQVQADALLQQAEVLRGRSDAAGRRAAALAAAMLAGSARGAGDRAAADATLLTTVAGAGDDPLVAVIAASACDGSDCMAAAVSALQRSSPQGFITGLYAIGGRRPESPSSELAWLQSLALRPFEDPAPALAAAVLVALRNGDLVVPASVQGPLQAVVAERDREALVADHLFRLVPPLPLAAVTRVCDPAGSTAASSPAGAEACRAVGSALASGSSRIADALAGRAILAAVATDAEAKEDERRRSEQLLRGAALVAPSREAFPDATQLAAEQAAVAHDILTVGEVAAAQRAAARRGEPFAP